MDMRVLLDVGSLLVVVVAAMRWRRNLLTRPADEAAMWLAAGYFVNRLGHLVGARDGVARYLLDVGGFACLVVGVYRLAQYRLSLSERKSEKP
jgi:hypothetical protein